MKYDYIWPVTSIQIARKLQQLMPQLSAVAESFRPRRGEGSDACRIKLAGKAYSNMPLISPCFEQMLESRNWWSDFGSSRDQIVVRVKELPMLIIVAHIVCTCIYFLTIWESVVYAYLGTHAHRVKINKYSLYPQLNILYFLFLLSVNKCLISL